MRLPPSATIGSNEPDQCIMTVGAPSASSFGLTDFFRGSRNAGMSVSSDQHGGTQNVLPNASAIWLGTCATNRGGGSPPALGYVLHRAVRPSRPACSSSWLVRITDIDGGTDGRRGLLHDVHQRRTARDLAALLSDASAAVIIGIIVMPMPMPITNSAPSISRIGVVSVICVKTPMPDRDQQADRQHELARAHLVVETSGHRHGQHRADTLRRQQQTGGEGGLARAPG